MLDMQYIGNWQAGNVQTKVTEHHYRRNPCETTLIFISTFIVYIATVSIRQSTMAKLRPVRTLLDYRSNKCLSQNVRSKYPGFCATFSTSPRRAALPSGSPTSSFRLPRPQRWDEGESSLDRAGKYFLFTEILRGMYVVLEQFFRAP